MNKIENCDFPNLHDILPTIFRFVSSTIEKNTFSLVCKLWTTVSDENTKIIKIFEEFNTDSNLITISQRFRFLKKLYISYYWNKDLIPNTIRSPFQANLKKLIHYNLPNKPITNNGIMNFNNLTRLNLSHNKNIIFECVKNFTNLKTLLLRGDTQIRDYGMQQLSNIKSLDLWENKLITDDGIKNLVNITNLDLSLNQTITNKGILNLTNLVKLNLSGNTLITNCGIVHLTSLTKLNLTGNSMIGNDYRFKNLSNLTSLSLHPISAIVDSDIMNLTNLSYLNCESHKNLTDNGVSTLTNLTFLRLKSDISSNTLTCFNKLTYLSSLNLTNEKIKHLTNLKNLKLEKTDFVTDDGIKSLTKLISIGIFVEKLITDHGLSHLINLTYLEFDDRMSLENITWNCVKTLTNLRNLNYFKEKLGRKFTETSQIKKNHTSEHV